MPKSAPRAYMMDGGSLRAFDAKTPMTLRSEFARQANHWLMDSTDKDPTTLARAYKAGLTAFVCINARATIAAEIPVKIYEGDQFATDRTPADDLMLHVTREIWRATANLLIYGVFYFRKRYNNWKHPSRLEQISPLDVQVDLDYSKGLVRGYRVQYPYGIEYVPAEQMIVYCTFNPFSDIDGTSALEVAFVRSGVEANVGNYGAAFFGNAARPDGLLTYDGPMSDTEQTAARTYWDKLFKGVRNAFRTAIMGGKGGKWTWTAVTPPPVDLAMTELSDQADMKICVALGVNPALVGIGKVADALSAQSTFRQIRQHHVEFVAIPDVRLVADALNEQWLGLDFAGQGWHIEPDIANIMTDALGGTERVNTAVNANQGRIWGVNEARLHTGKKPVEGLVEFNPDWALLLWQGGGLRHSEFRQAIGQAPDAQVSDGYIWQVDPRAQPAPAPTSPFSFTPSPTAPPPQLPPTAPKTAPVVEVPPQALPARSDVVTAAQFHELSLWRKRVKRDGPSARFNTEILPAPMATRIRERLAAGEAPVVIFEEAREWVRAGELPAVEGMPLYISLRLSDESRARVAGYADGLGAQLGDVPGVEWVDPALYHVTLVYAPDVPPTIAQAAILDRLPSQDAFPAARLEVMGLGVFDNPGEGQAVHLAIGPCAALVDLQAALAALFIEANIPLSPFSQPGAYRPHITLCYVPSGTPVPQADSGEIYEVLWPSAIQVSRSDYALVRDIPFVRAAPPTEQAAQVEADAFDFWKRFDDIQANLGADWLTVQGDVWATLADQLTPDTPDEAIARIMDGFQERLVNAWLGTAEQPGPMLALMLAGAAAGQDALQKGTLARPKRALPPDLGIDWTLVPKDALDFLRTYAFDLVSRLDATTRELMRKAIDRWMKSGQPIDVLKDELTVIFHSPVRAEMIAVSEATRVYFEGAVTQYKRAGVTKGRWETVNVGLKREPKQPGDVCGICAPLHKMIGDLERGWLHPNGQYYKPPAHTRCRCWCAPEVNA